MDPDIPVVNNEAELTEGHRAWAEDMSVEFLNKCNLTATKCYRLVNDDERGYSGGGICSLICWDTVVVEFVLLFVVRGVEDNIYYARRRECRGWCLIDFSS